MIDEDEEFDCDWPMDMAVGDFGANIVLEHIEKTGKYRPHDAWLIGVFVGQTNDYTCYFRAVDGTLWAGYWRKQEWSAMHTAEMYVRIAWSQDGRLVSSGIGGETIPLAFEQYDGNGYESAQDYARSEAVEAGIDLADAHLLELSVVPVISTHTFI